MPHPLLEDAPGKKLLLLGNEAIVRGALEAGIQCVACYPGTPSSEVPDTFFRLSPEGSFTFEYSVNEKVALEVAGGATIAGALTLATMKHVGVNVAADPLMTLAYIGTPGGLVLLSADDPGCHSSQNEQDNRFYARLAGLPCFEPATAQEAKDMTREALLLSRLWEQPVLLRTTTRVNHVRGVVELGPLAAQPTDKTLEKNPGRFVPVPANARLRHQRLFTMLETFRAEAENSAWNTVHGRGRDGIIASGISRAYLHDALARPDWQGRVKVLQLGLSWPLPEKKLAEFLLSCERVLVLEELEPILENDLRALANRLGLPTPIFGKTGGPGEADGFRTCLPRHGEYGTPNVYDALHLFLEGQPAPLVETCYVPDDLPGRPPNLCAGCSHRALYYAVRRVFGDEAVYSSDIGCYTLGILPPLSAADFLLCMGSSISAGSGAARASGKTLLGFIGDSTFFHSGITGLINAVFNRHDLLVVILDNKTTAMTGHQPHPGVENTALGPNPARVDIEAIVHGCGVEHVRKVSPYNLKATLAALEELKALPGVRVLIAEEACVLFARRTLKKKPGQMAYVAEQGEEVQRCLDTLACPAFRRGESGIEIDPEQCAGCMVCLQVTRQIKARKRSA